VAGLLAGNVPLVSGQGGAPDPGKRGHAGMRVHGGMIGGAPLITIALKHKDDLALSAEQTGNLEKIREHYQTQVRPLHQQLQAVEKEILALSQESPANLIQIKAKIQESEKHRTELRYLRMEALENGKTVLTPEQQEKLKSLTRARFEHFRKNRPAQAS
jgi:Spy/CpxP family protein refolding chaperone